MALRFLKGFIASITSIFSLSRYSTLPNICLYVFCILENNNFWKYSFHLSIISFSMWKEFQSLSFICFIVICCPPEHCERQFLGIFAFVSYICWVPFSLSLCYFYFFFLILLFWHEVCLMFLLLVAFVMPCSWLAVVTIVLLNHSLHCLMFLA